MKSISKIIPVFIMALMCAFACEPAEKPGGIEKPEGDSSLSLNVKLLKFSSKETGKTVQLTTEAENWTAAMRGDNGWFAVEPSSGSGSAELTITCAVNDGKEHRGYLDIVAGENKLSLLVSQDKDAEIANRVLYTEPDPANADAACTLYFKDKDKIFSAYSGELYAHIGVHIAGEWCFVKHEWNENSDECKFVKTGESNTWKLELGPTVRDYFQSGVEPVERLAVVVRTADGKSQTKDLFVSVQDDKYHFEAEEPEEKPLPAGMKHGINYDGSAVTLVLYDKDTEGNMHDYCYVIGDFNDWKREKDYLMYLDKNAGCWWRTLNSLDPGREYMFQYYIGDKEGNAMRISDPYTEIVYDSNNDHYIPASTYPGLPVFPSNTSGVAGAFRIQREEYSWKVPDFHVADVNDLVIYELLFRDFSSTGDIPGAIEHFDYLKNLGINAIELMPVQEFDGNDSWGYNPFSFFAMDKAYGTRKMYKEFIDLCHENGIAVIVDVVYNHATGQSPFAKLFWDSENNRTSATNPWFNVEAPHPYSVFHDFNHESELTREYVKRSLVYLIEEYHVDGFRFDLTKGFTNRKCTEQTASNYDAGRIAILKDYYSAIKAAKDDIVMICEHFCADSEEKELAAAGLKVWRNCNNAFCQAAMGFSSESNFSALWHGSNGMSFGGYVGFMESHDEERMAYKQKAYGQGNIKTDLAVRMDRLAVNAAMSLLVPGPKMIWQFGELGYDVSIEEGGRTGKKPLHWEYYDNAERRSLYDTYSDLLGFRNDNPRFFDSDAKCNYRGSAWDNGFRTVTCSADGKTFWCLANMNTSAQTVNVDFAESSGWTNYFDRSEKYENVQKADISIPAGEFKLFVNF